MHISMHASLCSSVSYFGIHLAQILIPIVLVDDRICRSMAHIQLFSCISDSNPSVLLNHSINLITIVCCCELVGQPNWSSLLMPVLLLWNLSTHWYTFLCIMHNTVFASDHKNQMTARCLMIVQSKSGANMFTPWLHKLH
jgi:hypothetical protein